MNPRQIAVLLRKEIASGARSFFFVFAIVIPLGLTFMVQVLFGSVFSGKPTLAVVDQGSSRLTALLLATESISVRQFDSAAELRDAVGNGGADMGIVLPATLDAELEVGTPGTLTAFVWGESLLRNRTILGTTLAALLREAAGSASLVQIATTVVGAENNVPLSERFLPLIVLMTIVLGGAAVPAASLVDEKQKRTLRALTITPTSIGDVLVSKGLIGVLVSVIMALMVLILNNAFGGEPLLLLVTLLLSAAFSAALGVLIGALAKNLDTLFAVLKGTGILLYAPAFIFLFPQVPQWIARLFPTYYMVKPVIDISQFGASFSDVAPDLGILIALLVTTVAVVVGIVRRPDGKLSLQY